MKALLLAALLALPGLAQSKAQSFVLPNGLRVVHLEDHERPLVRVLLQVRLEPTDTPPGLGGLPLLWLRASDHSDAAEFKAEAFDRLLAGAGIQLDRTLRAGGVEWRLVARSRDQDRALGLLADRVLRTVFDPAAVEAQRVACWREEEGLDAPPGPRLRRALEPFPGPRPTLASLGAITLDDLLAFQARVVRPDRAVLVLHGDLGLEQAKRLVFLSLGPWTAAAPSPRQGARLPAAPTTEGPVRLPAAGTGLRLQAVVQAPAEGAPEAKALLSLLVPADPALAPLRVASEAGDLVITLEAQDAPAAWRLFHDRLEALRQRGYGQADLERARTAWRARQSLEALHPQAQLTRALAEVLAQGVRSERLASLSLEALNADLRRWLDPARLRLGATGSPEALKTLPTP